MKNHMNYMTRALQSRDPRFARILGNLGYPMPAGEIDTKVVNQPSGVMEIPSDWASMHWAKQAKLAEQIVGSEDAFNASAGKTKADKAKTIIEAELARRGE